MYATDAESGQSRNLFRDVPQRSWLTGASSDGQWMYLVTADTVVPRR
ncbi:hypothetical protein PV433_18060 [Paenibacillus sp. GYB004]